VGLTLLTVGVPTLFLTLWARPTTPDEHMLGNLARFVIPAAIVTAGFRTQCVKDSVAAVAKQTQCGPAQDRSNERRQVDGRKQRWM
jgi:hypothetical protein